VTRRLAVAAWLGTALVSGQAHAQSKESVGGGTEAPDTTEGASEPGLLGRAFWYGPGAGSPSTGKTVTVFTLYGLGVASLGAGGYFLVNTLEDRKTTDRFLTGTPAPCLDRASASCAELIKLRESESESSHYTLLAGAGAGIFLVAGLLTALLWENEPAVANASGLVPVVTVAAPTTPAYAGVVWWSQF
jgi:hypothetical protein